MCMDPRFVALVPVDVFEKQRGPAAAGGQSAQRPQVEPSTHRLTPHSG